MLFGNTTNKMHVAILVFLCFQFHAPQKTLPDVVGDDIDNESVGDDFGEFGGFEVNNFHIFIIQLIQLWHFLY